MCNRNKDKQSYIENAKLSQGNSNHPACLPCQLAYLAWPGLPACLLMHTNSAFVLLNWICQLICFEHRQLISCHQLSML